VQAELRRAAALWDRPGTQTARVDDTRVILEELVRKFPDDIQANRRFQNDARVPKGELIARYKKRSDAKPDEALSLYLYGLSLNGRDTPEAMRLFAAALAKDRDLAWAHMALAYNYNYGRLADKAKTTEHVDAFFELCPTSYDFFTNRMLGTNGSPALQKKVAVALRARVEAETDANLLGIYEHLWGLEFKIAAPAEHGALRVKIVSDIERIRRMSPEPTLARLRLIRDGLRQANNAEGVKSLEEELIQHYPDSRDVWELTRERWEKAHPRTPTPEYRAAQYAVNGEWMARWPWNAIARVERFSTARQLKNLPEAEMKAAADQLLTFLRGNEVIYGFQPFEHQAAEEYLARGIFVNEVARLAEEGVATVRARDAGSESSDLELPANARRRGAALRGAEIGAVDLLAQAYLKLGTGEKASALEKRLDASEADGDYEKGMQLRAASRVAELAGRKMDAFVYLEKVLETGPKATNDFQKKREAEIKAELRRLWSALGGTEKTWAMRTKVEVREAKAEGGWKAPEKKIAAWDLVDIGGRRWTSDTLAGKTVFINVWATWCGPCRAEHPHFQKLYDKVKDRKDVAVISFNVDDQVGLVQSYMDEGKFTFPVLLASRYVTGLLDAISIPRNWLVDKRGAHQLEQIGFGETADWVERMAQAVEGVK
jgi:thiol-disulfide isomerase/thioredoxin